MYSTDRLADFNKRKTGLTKIRQMLTKRQTDRPQITRQLLTKRQRDRSDNNKPTNRYYPNDGQQDHAADLLQPATGRHADMKNKQTKIIQAGRQALFTKNYITVNDSTKM